MLSGPVVGSRGVVSEDLVNLQAWEGPVLLGSRCGLFSAPALPVAVVPLVHVSASPLRIEVCVCVCVCVCVLPFPSTSRVILSITLSSQIKTLLPSRRWGKWPKFCVPTIATALLLLHWLHEGSFHRIHRHLPSL